MRLGRTYLKHKAQIRQDKTVLITGKCSEHNLNTEKLEAKDGKTHTGHRKGPKMSFFVPGDLDV